MSSLSVRLPESLHESLRNISKKEHISINQFIASAIGEKITALETEDYIASRADRGNKESYFSILEKVKDIEPDDLDL